jgi:anti-sigma B factor antagonist
MLLDSDMFKVSLVPDRTCASGPTPDVFAVEGELDVATSPTLTLMLQMVLDSAEPWVVVDMAAVTFIDALSIGTLVKAAKKTRKVGGALVLSRPSPTVLRLLSLLQLDDTLPVLRRTDVMGESRRPRVDIATLCQATTRQRRQTCAASLKGPADRRRGKGQGVGTTP